MGSARVDRVMLAGTHSGCGKTTVTCAVLQALARRGLDVAGFKCGPDYIDPMFHSQITGTSCRNIDLHLLDEDTVRYLLAKNGAGHDLALLEGVMGYYDGAGMTSRASSYAAARATGTPAVLVVSARGAARSLLAAVAGFLALEPDSGIRGVIFDRCSPALYPRLARAVEERFEGAVRPLGYLPALPDCALESRHLGLVTAAEVEGLCQTLQVLGEQAERSVDLDGLVELARSAPSLPWREPSLPEPGEPVRVGLARDRAFCFYYEDSLDLLRRLGAQLVEFSPLEDAHLPEDLHGLILGGGYPELYAARLGQNASLRAEIRAALERGVPCIAECGGFLYLHEALEGEPMVGLLPGAGVCEGKLVRFGYVTLTARRDGLLCRAGEKWNAHEFHYWDVPDPGDGFTAEKGGRQWECAVHSDTLYAGFPHLHFFSCPAAAERFLNACRKEEHSHA